MILCHPVALTRTDEWQAFVFFEKHISRGVSLNNNKDSLNEFFCNRQQYRYFNAKFNIRWRFLRKKKEEYWLVRARDNYIYLSVWISHQSERSYRVRINFEPVPKRTEYLPSNILLFGLSCPWPIPPPGSINVITLLLVYLLIYRLPGTSFPEKQ